MRGIWCCVPAVILVVTGCYRTTEHTDSLSDRQLELHALQTAERRAHLLPPQTADPELMAKAQDWAETMARRGRMYHSTMIYHENVAQGTTTAKGTIQVWMRSRGHRTNLLSQFDRCGFGHAVSRRGDHYWCSLHAP